MKDIRVVFMGTPSFAVPILEGLIDKYNVVMVVSQPDRKKNRRGELIKPDTKILAEKHNIPVFQPIKIKEEYQEVLDMRPDIIITCAYGQIIPEVILNYPRYGCINVHGSLLPRLRGGAPIHHAIINGDSETGVTVMSMSKKMDAGDIISRRSIKIEDNMILDELYSKMSYLGRDLLLDTMPSIIDGTATYTKQDETLVTFGYNVTKEEEKINFNNSGKDIKNRVRGLNSVPGAYCYFDDLRMKIYEVEVVNTDKYKDREYGLIIEVTNDSIGVTCSDGLVYIKDIAIEGKKRCMVKDYFNGIKKENLIGKVLK